MRDRRVILCPPGKATDRDREIVDRFADFLATMPPAITADEARRRPLASPATRYRRRLLLWRMSPAALDLSARLEAVR